jgi:hypothetical protein
VVVEIEKDQEEMIRFVEGLKTVNSSCVDFKSAVSRYLDEHPTKPAIKELILKIMDESNERK